LIETEQAAKQIESKHARVERKRTKVAICESSLDGKLGSDWKFQNNPSILKDRVEYFDSLLKMQIENYSKLPAQKIKITLPDSAAKEGESFKTSSFYVAKMISKQFAEKIFVSKERYPEGRIATLDDGFTNPEAPAEKQGDR
jgi:hypothetical protein